MSKKTKRLEIISNICLFIGIALAFGLVGRIEYDSKFGLSTLDTSFLACLIAALSFLYFGAMTKSVVNEIKTGKLVEKKKNS